MMKCTVRCWDDAILRHDQYGGKYRSRCSFSVGFISEGRNNFGRGTYCFELLDMPPLRACRGLVKQVM